MAIWSSWPCFSSPAKLDRPSLLILCISSRSNGGNRLRYTSFQPFWAMILSRVWYSQALSFLLMGSFAVALLVLISASIPISDPMILRGDHLIWILWLVAPLLATSILAAPADSSLMKRTPEKNDPKVGGGFLPLAAESSKCSRCRCRALGRRVAWPSVDSTSRNMLSAFAFPHISTGTVVA